MAVPFYFERSFYDAMVDYWASFARSGQPVSDGNPTWPAYADGQSWMVFSDAPRVARDVLIYRYDLVDWNVALGSTGRCRILR
ncbi:MAG: carboxylesterase family protein [Erythrobacter sp.]|nr:carboxylesterase family protein [Erythrobacter sp.]